MCIFTSKDKEGIQNKAYLGKTVVILSPAQPTKDTLNLRTVDKTYLLKKWYAARDRAVSTSGWSWHISFYKF